MKPRAVLLLTASALLLAACANALPPRREVRQGQPLPEEVARRITAARNAPDEYPDFRDIPTTPGDVRTPAQFRAAVRAIQGQGAALQTWAADNPPEIPVPEVFAARARQELGIGPEDVPPPDQAAQIEALARELRRRAEPPPAIPD